MSRVGAAFQAAILCSMVILAAFALAYITKNAPIWLLLVLMAVLVAFLFRNAYKAFRGATK